MKGQKIKEVRKRACCFVYFFLMWWEVGQGSQQEGAANGCYVEAHAGGTGSGHVVFPSSLGPSAEET